MIESTTHLLSKVIMNSFKNVSICILLCCASFLYADSIVFLPSPKPDKQKENEVDDNVNNEVNLNLFDIQKKSVTPKDLKGFEIIEGDELPQEDSNQSKNSYLHEEIILAQNTHTKIIGDKEKITIKDIVNGATFIAVSTKKNPQEININGKIFPWIPHPLDASKKIAIIPINYRAKLGTLKLNNENTINIKQGNYKRENIQLKDASKAKPNKQANERIARELDEANKIYKTFTKNRYWKLPFKLPLESVITSPFGSARIFNGEVKSFHSGTDFRAKIGTPIYAINDGVVVIAKERFLAGKSVVLDHGEGIFSMYYHCSDIKVKLGQKVSKGQLLALSGDTGRVSGAHLHFGILVNGIQVNPINFIEVMNNLSKDR